MIYTYSDSLAGLQSNTFDTLSETIAHIEGFDAKGESGGTVYQDGEAILAYHSTESSISWIGLDCL